MKHILPIFLLMFFSCQDNPAPSGPEPIGQLTGIVYDDSTQTPVEGISVDLSLNDVSEVTDSLGVYTFDSLSVGRDTLTIFSDIHDSLSHIVDIMEGPQELNFYLDYNLGQLTGIVMDDSLNQPLRNIFVSLSNNDRTDTTNSSGEFFFDSLKTGAEELRVYSAYTDSFSTPITLTKGVNQLNYDVKRFPCFDDRPTEDTTRKYNPDGYEWLMDQNIFYVRFDSSLKDTSELYQFLDKYNLGIAKNPFGSSTLGYYRNNFEAVLCIKDGLRPEYYFTPFGKENYCNFGAESNVEYAWAIFNGPPIFLGQLIIKFQDDINEDIMHDFYKRYGLRHMYTDATNFQIVTLTKKSPKNTYDLFRYLMLHEQTIIKIVDPNVAQSTNPFVCD